MPPNNSFESQSFNPFSLNEDLKDNGEDPDINFYQTQISSLDTNCYIPNEVMENLENFQQKQFSVLYLNIRSMSKNFESLREFLHSLCFSFSAICLSGASLTKLHFFTFERTLHFFYLNPSLTKSEMT